MVLIVAGGGLVLFGGILSTLAIYGVRKYIANAKTAEARSSLGQIGKDAATAYELGSVSTRGATTHRLCASASRPIPASLSSIRGAKYQSTASEWEVDAARNAGFACLKFEMAAPQYFRYSYTAAGQSSPGDHFDALAEGDLNGDGVTSEFRLTGKIGADKNLFVAPNILEKNPEE